MSKDLNATEALLYDIYTLELTHEIAHTDEEGIERYEKVEMPVGIRMRATHTDNDLQNKENLRESFDSFADCLYTHIFGESRQREGIPNGTHEHDEKMVEVENNG